MTGIWRERAWKFVFFSALLVATALLLSPTVPGGGGPVGVDKLQHVLLFAGLAILGARAYRDKPRWGIFAALVFFGLCAEIGQTRTGRSFELLDIAADALGAAAVFLAPRARG